MADGVTFFRDECSQQPESLRSVFDAYGSDSDLAHELEEMRRAIPADKPVLWLGMGASFYGAVSGAERLVSLGKASFAVEASEWLHFGQKAWRQLAGPVLLTTSGERAELIELLNRDKQQPGILICNEDKSRCWTASSIRLPILAGTERSNATKSFTNATAISVIAASFLMNYPWGREASDLMDVYARAHETCFALRQDLEEFVRGHRNMEVIGRGAARGAAGMGALCIREMSGLRVPSLSGGQFRHGPILDVDASHVVIILALGRTAELGGRLARDCTDRGGKVVLVCDEDTNRTDQLYPVVVPKVPEAWEGLIGVLPCQALTLALIERSGTRYERFVTTVL